jgi:hypothetical protein
VVDSIPHVRSAQAQTRGNLVHTWGYTSDTTLGHVMEGLMAPETALELAQSLIQSAALAISNQRRNLARGDCDTCKNVRMVKDNRDRSIHCPDCSEGAEQRPIPTIPGWAEDEAALIR